MDVVTSPPVRWLLKERNRDAEARLQRELSVPSLVAAVLVQRGICDPAEAWAFLNPRLEDLHDPRMLPDYDLAVKAILGARERKELIYVHGDYDVDGVTSASIFKRFLENVGCSVVAHVPHRMKEGYGIHESAVADAVSSGAKLFLTCDCGSGAIEQIAAAKAAGLAVVVTDHHTIGHETPDADAFINPHRTDSVYPFAELSGAGVAFKLCQGLTTELGIPIEKFTRAFLDLAALGTIADVMPLLGENRIIARHGLERLGDTKKPGLKALKAVAGIKVAEGEPLKAYHVGFVLGPRLNAAGRIDDAAIALKLLLTNDAHEATELAKTIEEVNLARRDEQDRIVEQAIQRVLEEGYDKQNVIVVSGEGWHSGIVGIVAGRLVEKFHKPTFVLNIGEDGVCKGSARGIPNYNLADAIREFPELFITGGGHAMAAGCSFKIDDLEAVQRSLHEHAGARLSPDDFVPSTTVDIEIEPSEVTMEAAEGLSLLEPFGCENPTPLFLARDLDIAQILPTRNPAHVRLALKTTQANTVNGIAFGIGERFTSMGAGGHIDVLFQPSVDEWRGTKSLKWQIKDFRGNGADTTQRKGGFLSP